MRIVHRFAFAFLVFAASIFTRSAYSEPPQSRPAAPGAVRTITVDDYFQIRDVGQPELSPDGQWVAYTVRTKMLKEDKNETRIWMVSTKGGDAIPMTAEGVSSGHPRWSPDGKYLAFTSSRNGGKGQVWLLNRVGGEAVRLTDIPQGAGDFEWSPDGTRLVLILQDPKPEGADAEKEKDKPAPAKPKTQPPWVIDRLQFKEDTVGYLDNRRTHLYVFSVEKKSLTQITSGDFDDSQPAWSPDGKQLAFNSNRSMPDPDASRDSNIWVVGADNTDKGAHLTQITTNPGADSQPAWSPNGKWIAYVTQLDKHLFWYATQHLAIAPSNGGEAKKYSRWRLTAMCTARAFPVTAAPSFSLQMTMAHKISAASRWRAEKSRERSAGGLRSGTIRLARMERLRRKLALQTVPTKFFCRTAAILLA
jgi:dipeptidyl aminopeptidase/acylaminoacyl peptidase